MFPRDVLLAFKLAKVDPAEWLREVVRGYSSGVNVGVSGPFVEEYPSGEVKFGVFELFCEEPSVGDEVLDELELAIDSRIYGLATSLTEREKVVLVKRVEEGKSLAEIAFELGVKPQSVVSFLNAIKEKVKSRL